jgi:hypothetical protein
MDMSVVTLHNFDQINTYVLQPLCANFSVCHSTAGQKDADGLNLAVDPYKALVGAPAQQKMAKAEGKLRVKPCDPDNSFLILKLTLPVTQRDSNVGYGASMPKDNLHLPPEQLQAIKDWIARGALMNEPEMVTGNTCVTDDAAVPDLRGAD